MNDLNNKARQKVIGSTTWVPVTPLLKQFIANGFLFSVEIDNEQMVPMYAIKSDGMPLQVVSELINILQHHTSLQIAAWIESSSSYLSGQSPKELLESDPTKVVDAAKDRMLDH